MFCNSQCITETACEFLKKNGEKPEVYVLSKFKNYDYVFLGEYHRNKQDVDFVTSLISGLYENGVRNIAYEFYEYANQSIIDSLLTAKAWNESFLFHTLSKKNDITWGYSEYLNLLKKNWEFNQTLKDNQPKFRIVLLGSQYNPCKEGLEMFGGIDPDKFMANVFEKEVVSKGEKALIYCGMHHAFTSYYQPIYDFEEKKLLNYNKGRLGNILHEKYPQKTFTIFLHSPWTSIKGWEEQDVKPVDGVIDSAMEMLKNEPMGFDVKNTFMGTLKSTNSYYSLGYENFKLEDYCDGYIFLLPYRNVKFVSVEPKFYDDYNLKKLKEYLKCRGWSDEMLEQINTDSAVELFTEKAENHFGDLIK